jgi:acyl-CoA thioester hydrolase
MMSVFTTQIDIRFRDVDAMGHVNNAVFFTYFEEGRKRFFFELFKVSDPSAFPFIMAHISCDYLRPIKLGNEPVLQMWVKEIGTKSFNLGYKLVDASDKDIVYAKGESVQVCYDYTQSKSMGVPEELKQTIKEYQILDS